MSVDPAALTADLIRCPSVTPEEGGAIALLDRLLSEAGFTCTRTDRGGIANLHARWGGLGNGRVFGFNGHTDVVPTGPREDWTHDPFGAEIVDGVMYGRGACDMKSGVAAFAAAAIDFVRDTPPDGAVVLTITGDEEADGVHGTAAILDWMAANGERMDVCLVGEPTCPDTMGEMIKIGRRGSVTAYFTATGVQGHSAYPHRAKNPLPAMMRLMDRLASRELDRGNDHFDPSTLAITTVDTGNPASNVIPGACRATVNIRFNDTHSAESLIGWLREETEAVAKDTGIRIGIETKITGESFLTPPGALSDLVGRAVEAETGVTPVLSTTGGTSDARFVKDLCPVVEFGLVGRTMHKADECVEVAHIHQLKTIYGRILKDYFA
ncbi:succinyl-diaminopimelate desuccinylase [Oceaniglobus roseus]|uniref:succinyl-diaminopimelate desuccinylase n=1 Tax=Oceaniglobus roseus TaxID=1737570 RepID=UPI000C7F1423|nr:succinyl-diaminopimelate desuccinylase [Kandeliimicrobium roseum]